MTVEFDDVYREALQSSDVARPLGDEVRRRIAEQTLAAFDSHGSGEKAPVTLINVEQASADVVPWRFRTGRWVAAAAACLAMMAVSIGLLARDNTSTLEVSGPDTTPELAAEVREWCLANLGELTSTLDVVGGAPTDAEAQATALSELVETVDGYFWLLLESGIREGTLRANEVGRFGGEVAVLRDRAEPASIEELRTIVEQFNSELATTSESGSVCEVQG